MADSLPPEQSSLRDTAPCIAQAEGPKFQYPHVETALNASFEDLLNNSILVLEPTPKPALAALNPDTTSATGSNSNSTHLEDISTNKMETVESRGRSLGDSWDTFEGTDVQRQDDDSTSIKTDTESLVDIRSTSDIHSLDEEGALSEGSSSEAEDQNEDFHKQEDSHDTILVEEERPTTLLVEDETDVNKNIIFMPQDIARNGHKYEFYDEYSHTVKVLDEKHIFAAKMRLSNTPLRLPSTSNFNVLYYNSSSQTSNAEQIKFNILEKVGDALLACSDSNATATRCQPRRYSIIPSEFGPGSRPMAELAPFQQSISVQECETVKENTLNVIMKDGETVAFRSRSGTNQDVTLASGKPWAKPDLIVVCTGNDSTDSETRVCNALMHVGYIHQIPALLLRTDSGLGEYEGLSISRNRLHECIEDTVSADDRRVIERVPMGLDTFFNIDPRQLSQHIACLQKDHVKKQGSGSKPQHDNKGLDGWKIRGHVSVQHTLSIMCFLIAAVALIFRTTMLPVAVPEGFNSTALQTISTTLGSTAPSATMVVKATTLNISRPERLTIGQAASMFHTVHDLAHRELSGFQIHRMAQGAHTASQNMIEKVHSILQETHANSHALLGKTSSDLALQVQRTKSDLAVRMQELRDVVPVVDMSMLHERFRASIGSPALAQAQANAQQIVAKTGQVVRRERERLQDMLVKRP